jgi:hypothetical protein
MRRAAGTVTRVLSMRMALAAAVRRTINQGLMSFYTDGPVGTVSRRAPDLRSGALLLHRFQRNPPSAGVPNQCRASEPVDEGHRPYVSLLVK